MSIKENSRVNNHQIDSNDKQYLHPRKKKKKQ